MGLCARRLRIACVVLLSTSSIPLAGAETTPAGDSARPAGQGPDTAPAKESVSVTAKRAPVQVLPDRMVYAIDQSLVGETGSLSDALRTLPSVSIDIEGNVALRGDSNVTILIDGKQSPLLAGDRATALQQLPANMVERIEVITNPSAEFRAEGSGGIINIVLKKQVEAASSGSIRLSTGDRGRAKGSLTGTIKHGRFEISGGYGEVRDGRKYVITTARTNPTGSDLTQDFNARYDYAGRYVWQVSAFTLDEHNVIEFGANYNRWSGRYTSSEHTIAAMNGSNTTRDGLMFMKNEGAGLQLAYTHNFAQKDEKIYLELSQFGYWNRTPSDYVSRDTATGLANFWQSRLTGWRRATTELLADYTRPLPHQGFFKTGYALQVEGLDTANQGRWRDALMSDWADETGFTSQFALDRTVHAGYAEVEQKYGRFGVLGGLRLEQEFRTTTQKSAAQMIDSDALGLYPSLHLSYAVSDTQALKLSYSRRVNRPGSAVLNPARYTADAANANAGNPYLKNEEIDSVEAVYRRAAEHYDLVFTGYYRATYNAIARIYRNLSDTVLLSTYDNQARATDAGLEASFTATPLKSLTLRTNGALSYAAFNPGPASGGLRRSGLSWSISGGMDWQITPDDLVQFNANVSGKKRLAESISGATYSGDIGYKHALSPKLSALLSVNNLFDSVDRRSTIDRPGLHQSYRNRSPGRIYFIGLVYTFGGYKDEERITGSDTETAPSTGL